MNKPLARAHAALQALARPDTREGVKARVDLVRAGDETTEATIFIYDEIGGFGVQASDFVPALAHIDAPEIQVRLNSPGGDYFDGVAIANALQQHPARVTVHVDGLAASAASVIAMAGDEVVMHPGSRMMIHDAITGTIGNARDHAAAMTLLEGVSADIAEVYALRTGQRTAPEWRDSMLAESWYSADEAVSLGLANRAVSRETTPEPAPAGQWHELVALWRATAPEASTSTVDADAPPADSSPSAVLPLPELMCSAYPEGVA